jgi:hypothetical protein
MNVLVEYFNERSGEWSRLVVDGASCLDKAHEMWRIGIYSIHICLPAETGLPRYGTFGLQRGWIS